MEEFLRMINSPIASPRTPEPHQNRDPLLLIVFEVVKVLQSLQNDNAAIRTELQRTNEALDEVNYAARFPDPQPQWTNEEWPEVFVGFLTISSSNDQAKQENENPQTTMRADTREKSKVATRTMGTVKWFNDKKRYGFISRHGTKEDLFVHQTAIRKNNPKKVVPSLRKGEIVQFDAVIGKKGCRTINITGPGGVPVESPHARKQQVPTQRRFVPNRPRKQVAQRKKHDERHHRHADARSHLHQTGYLCFHHQRFGRRDALNHSE